MILNDFYQSLQRNVILILIVLENKVMLFIMALKFMDLKKSIHLNFSKVPSFQILKHLGLSFITVITVKKNVLKYISLKKEWRPIRRRGSRYQNSNYKQKQKTIILKSIVMSISNSGFSFAIFIGSMKHF